MNENAGGGIEYPAVEHFGRHIEQHEQTQPRDGRVACQQFHDHGCGKGHQNNRQGEAENEELRMAITLREVDGLSYDEISETMNCPIGTVRSRIFRARDAIDQKLRSMLDQPRARP